MITYKDEYVKRKVFESIACDRCKKPITDDMEIQEVYCIDLVGGYASVFGDGTRITCDLCQHCLHELIKDFCVHDATYE